MNVRGVLVLLSALAVLSPVLACSQKQAPAWDSPEQTSKLRAHQVVQISDAYLRPTEARFTASGGVTWVNISSGHVAQVVFPASIQKSLGCDDVRPRWSVASDTIRSIIISGGEEDLVLPCGEGTGEGVLPPGEYAYEVWIYPGSRGGSGPGAYVGSPQSRLEGKLVVE